MKKCNGIVITMMMVLILVADSCKIPGQYCNVAQGKICCGGLHCEGSTFGEDRKCVPSRGCLAGGKRCNIASNECCYPYYCNAMGSGYCVRANYDQLPNMDTFSTDDDRDNHLSSSTS
ncbi:hypothetical protein CsatA_005666 [Cannabis sativa]